MAAPLLQREPGTEDGRAEDGSPEASHSNPFPPNSYVVDIIGFGSKQLYRDPSFLHQKYVVEGLSPRQIAQLSSSSKTSVVTHLRKTGIPLRGTGGSYRPGQVPFGKRLAKGQLVDNKGELEILNRMMRFRSEGLSYWRIAEMLNLWGVKTKTPGARWQAATVMKMLKRSNISDS